MPPLQTPGIASMIPGAGDGGRVTGRMHAAPTTRPGTAGECGGVKTPPYRVAGTGNFPAPRAVPPVSPRGALPCLAVWRGLWYHNGSAAPPVCAARNNQKKVHFLCPIRN